VRSDTKAAPWFRLLLRVMFLVGCLALAAAMAPDRAPDGDAEAMGTP
jgi:hypothetical protein